MLSKDERFSILFEKCSVPFSITVSWQKNQTWEYNSDWHNVIWPNVIWPTDNGPIIAIKEKFTNDTIGNAHPMGAPDGVK